MEYEGRDSCNSEDIGFGRSMMNRVGKSTSRKVVYANESQDLFFFFFHDGNGPM